MRDGVIERETEIVRDTHLVIVGVIVEDRDRLVVADLVRCEAVLDTLVVRVTLPSKLVEMEVVIEILALFTGVIVRVEVATTVCERLFAPLCECVTFELRVTALEIIWLFRGVVLKLPIEAVGDIVKGLLVKEP